MRSYWRTGQGGGRSLTYGLDGNSADLLRRSSDNSVRSSKNSVRRDQGLRRSRSDGLDLSSLSWR